MSFPVTQLVRLVPLEAELKLKPVGANADTLTDRRAVGNVGRSGRIII